VLSKNPIIAQSQKERKYVVSLSKVTRVTGERLHAEASRGRDPDARVTKKRQEVSGTLGVCLKKSTLSLPTSSRQGREEKYQRLQKKGTEIVCKKGSRHE